MTRKTRIRLVIALVVLGPVAACLVVLGWFLWSGRLERNVEAGYAARLPGRLQVGRIEFSGTDTVVIHDLSLGEDGQPPLLTARRATAKLRLLASRLDELRIEDGYLRLDARSWKLLNAIIDKERSIPATRPAEPQHFILSGGALIGADQQVTDVAVDLTVTGPFVADGGRVTGRLAGQPFAVNVSTDRRSTGEMRYRIEAETLHGDLQPMLTAVEDIGMIGRSPSWLRAYLPHDIDAAGTVVWRDAETYHWLADIRAVWPPGSATASASMQLTADRHRLSLADLRYDDPAVIRLGLQRGGRLTYDQSTDHLRLSADDWTPGPRLPIPEAVPTTALLAQLPVLELEADCRAERAAVSVAFRSLDAASKARISLDWSHDNDHIRVSGVELPLSVAGGFLPQGLTVAGGQAEEARITIADGRLRDFFLKARQARFGINEWSFGPGDGTFVLVPGEGSAVSFKADLGLGQMSWSGDAHHAQFSMNVRQLDSFLARLRGPVDLPPLTGALEATGELTLAATSSALSGKLNKLTVTGLGRSDLLDDVDARMAGEFAWTGRSFSVRSGGQLSSGRLRLPFGWIDLAQRTPRFAAEVAYLPAEGYAPAAIDLISLLVRAADQRGEPVSGGFSAELAGSLTALGTGSLRGVVDHADLAWLARLAPQPDATITGETAMVFEADLLRSRVRRVAGSFLPLDAFLKLGRTFTANGITGAITYELIEPAESAP